MLWLACYQRTDVFLSSATLEQGALRGEVDQAASEVDIDEVLSLETNGDDL